MAPTLEHVFTIQDLLWSVLDFLEVGIEMRHPVHWVGLPSARAGDIINVSWTRKSIRKCCRGYILKWDWVHPNCMSHCPLGLRYRRAVVECSLSAAALSVANGVRDVRLSFLGGEPSLPMLKMIPAGVQSLWIDRPFLALTTLVLPPGLQRLGGWFGPGVLPDSLRELRLGSFFDEPLAVGVLPNSLRELRLGSFFDKPLAVGALPAGLQVLALSSYFNQPLLPGVLPDSLTVLSMGDLYNHQLQPGVLPDGLLQLTLSDQYTGLLEPGVLPKKLQKLKTGVCFSQKLVPGILPSGLQDLTMEQGCSLTPGALPPGMLRLTLWITSPLSADMLPAGLQVLHLYSSAYNGSLGFLPEGLQELRLPWGYHQKRIEKTDLPAQLRILRANFDGHADISVPEGCTIIRWDSRQALAARP